ncbi:MAG: hypothetical protein AABY22_12780 [Nanoarchaeota archaeon]
MTKEEIISVAKSFKTQEKIEKTERTEKTRENPVRIKTEPKTIQVSVMTRFLKGTELENFWKRYKANLKSIGGFGRETILKQPITKEELEMLKTYLTKFEIPLREIGEEKGLPMGTIYTKISKLANRVLAQNPSILDTVKTQD